MGASQQKQNPNQRTTQQYFPELQSCIKTLRVRFKKQISKLELNSRKIKLQLQKVMAYSTSDAAKRKIVEKYLKNSNEIQRYKKLDVHLEEALYNISKLQSQDGLVEMVKELADAMGVGYEVMKRVKTLSEALKVFEREIGNQIEDYNVLQSDQEEQRDEARREVVADNQSELGLPKVKSNIAPVSFSTIPATQNNVPINNPQNLNQRGTVYLINPQVVIARTPITQSDITACLYKLYPPPKEEISEKSKNSKENSVTNKKP